MDVGMIDPGSPERPARVPQAADDPDEAAGVSVGSQEAERPREVARLVPAPQDGGEAQPGRRQGVDLVTGLKTPVVAA
jgi:hypothetical protein